MGAFSSDGYDMDSQIRRRAAQRPSLSHSRRQCVRKRNAISLQQYSYNRLRDRKRTRFTHGNRTSREAIATAKHEIGGRSLCENGQYLFFGSRWSA